MKIRFGQMKNGYTQESESIRSHIDTIIMGPDFGGEVSFDDVREAAGKTKEQWPDGYIHQAAADMGLTVPAGDL